MNNETQSTSSETHRVGDIHDGLTTVAVNPPENLSIVRDVVERGVLPRRPKYRWLGHGMNTVIVESVKLGLHCGACGQLRTACRCGEAEAVRRLSVVNPVRRESKGWEAAAERAAHKIVSKPPVVNQGFVVNRESIALATVVPEGFTMAPARVGRPVSEAVQDLAWTCKRCEAQHVVVARPEVCHCGCAYFDRLPLRTVSEVFK